MMNKTSIGARLWRFQEAFHSSPNELAQILEIEPTRVKAIIEDAEPLSSDLAVKLQELGCSTAWLFTGIGKWWADNRHGEILRNLYERELAGTLPKNFLV